MALCLLCLNTIEDKLDSMRTNSSQWEELGVAKKIEKFFWSLITIQPNSWVCLSCWYKVEEFHKFYLCIEEAHNSFCKIKVEEFKNESTQISHVKKNEESDEDDMAYCFLEPEILIGKTEMYDVTRPDVDKIVDNGNQTDINVKSQLNENLKPQSFQESQDPLEKSKILIIEKTKKRKFSKRKDLVEKKSIEEKKTKSVNIKKEPEDLKENDSDSLSDKDDDPKDTNYLPDKDSLEKCKRPSNADGKYRITRDENDEFIAEHFKNMHCNICQEPLENFAAMRKHFSNVHRQRGHVVCCNKKYFNRRDLVDHIHCHLNPEHFKCTRCDKVLSDRVRLEKHNASVHGPEEVVKQHSCDICGKSYLDKSYLRRHKLTHLPEEEKKFPCEECGKFYGSSDLLHRHMQAVHLKKFVKICYICGKSFGSSVDLKIHMNKHEGIPQPIINCDVCGLRLTTERGLKRHKDSQHPADGKKEHFCPICPKVSPTLKALRKHISTMHVKGYDHKCAICQKAFKRAEVLREHMASHTGTPLYTCPWCPKTFNSNGNMHAHRKKMHPKEWEEAKLQKYSCNLKPTNNCK